MSRRKIGDRDIRKLTRLGRTSLAVTLPIEAIRSLGWREKQKVVVEQKGKTIIIRDWQA